MSLAACLSCFLAKPRSFGNPTQLARFPQGTNNYFNLINASSKLALDHVWKVRFFRMRASARKLARIEPSKASIIPFNDETYQFWPPIRGTGSRRPRGGGGDDGHDGGGDGKGKAAALEDALDDDNGDSQDEEDGEQTAEHRRIIHMLDEGVAAMRENAKRAAGTGMPEGPPGSISDSDDDIDISPQDSSDSSSSGEDDGESGDLPAAKVEEAALRDGAEARFSLPDGCGIIRYYAKTQNFTAECKCFNHIKCIKTRQSTSAAAMATAKKPSDNIKAKGRPLGYLAAWLQDGKQHASKKDHWALHNELIATEYTKRVAARTMLSLHPQGQALLAKERAKRDGEPDEPDGLP